MEAAPVEGCARGGAQGRDPSEDSEAGPPQTPRGAHVEHPDCELSWRGAESMGQD